MQSAHLLRVPYIAGFVLAAVFAFGALAAPVHAAVSDADGDGVMSVSPDTATAGDTGLSFAFDFEQDHNFPLLQRLTRSFYLPGSQLVLTIPEGWTRPQLDDSEAPGYLSIEQGDGGGPLHANSCNFTPLDVSIAESESGPWLVTIPQHCGYHDHLLITYGGVTAPEAGEYEFTGWTRAGFTGGEDNMGVAIDESPVVTVSPVCEEGYHADGIECEPNDPPQCGEGFVLDELNVCVEEGEVTPPSTCPEGTTFSSESGQCEGSSVSPEPCADGLVYSELNGQCEDPSPSAPTDCPEGYALAGDVCQQIEGPDQISPSCENPLVSFGEGQCALPPEVPECSVGTFNSGTGLCEVGDEAPSCPTHYNLVIEGESAMCVFESFEPTCGDGFHLSEDHSACFADPEPLSCEDGFHVEGEACVANTTSSSTIVVWPGNMHDWDLLNYDADLDSDSSATTTSGTGGFFIFGFTIPPLGDGSFEQIVGENGDEATRLRSSDYNGTLLSDITSLSYDTFTVANGGAQDTYLQLRIDRDANGEWDDALFFEPVYQSGGYGMLEYSPDPVPNQCGENPNCVTIGEWQHWDAFAGGWWPNSEEDGGPPLTTLSAYAAEYPDAVLATDVPAIRIQAGAGAPVWNNYNGAFDKFVIGVDSGSNTETTTYDFEPVFEEPSSGGGGGGTSHHPQERAAGNDGEVLGAETGPGTCPLLTSYLWPNNPANDAAQVKLLQAFLAKELGIELAVDGVYGEATTKAVMVFQLKYWEEVLAPWVPYGLPTAQTATGNVFKLTEWKINSISCAPTEVPAPTIP